ncbi:expressed unknown protein [Seminavis robusta]|uniref:Uncharacterized protein n=1 Tax=Seminavis robusta TaxID=568900 RepID=A0A9N8HDD5_9STRA|nr:expressed unknown protein [Seminavis robusta]|eukprot:Sro255_g100360.1 n/a (449) ;mRNA; f:31680-33026
MMRSSNNNNNNNNNKMHSGMQLSYKSAYTNSKGIGNGLGHRRNGGVRRWVVVTVVAWLGIVFTTYYCFSHVGHRGLLLQSQSQSQQHSQALQSQSTAENTKDSTKKKKAEDKVKEEKTRPPSVCHQLQLSSLQVFCQAQGTEQEAWAPLLRAVEPQLRFHQAAIECALAVDIPTCVHAALQLQSNANNNATQTIPVPKKPLPFRNQLGTVIIDEEDVLHDFTEDDATRACSGLTSPVDQIFCEKHFIQLDDEETAKHYIHLYLDTELVDNDNNSKQKQKATTTAAVPPEEAKALCSAVPEAVQKLCRKQVIHLPTQHIASHFVHLYNHNSTKWDAETLCHHIPTTSKSNPDNIPVSLVQLSCVQQLLTLTSTTQSPALAAERYMSFFRPTKATITRPQVQQDLMTLLGKTLCKGNQPCAVFQRGQHQSGFSRVELNNNNNNNNNTAMA